MFKIHQYTDNIEVFKDDVIYLKAFRKFNLLGQLTTTFVKGDLIILKSSYDIFLFHKFLKIKYQNLTKLVRLVKNGNHFILQADNKNLVLKRHYFKNPIYTIESNLELVAEISTKLNCFTESPIVYNFRFVNIDNAELELYYLIRFLIEVPPTMDV